MLNLSRKVNNLENRRSNSAVLELSFIDAMWAIMMFYAVFPQDLARSLFWHRPFGVPFSYVPFLIIFAVLFIKHILAHLMISEKGVLFKHRPIGLLYLFLGYIPVQFIILLQQGQKLFIKDFLIDYAMYCFYGVVVFYGTTLYFRKEKRPVVMLEDLFERSMKYLSAVCIISLCRFLIYDIHHEYVYFNLFYPLGYRMFEVLFLVFFLAVALGWYFATRQKRYLLYIFLYAITLIIAGSRTGYVAFILIILYILLRENVKILYSRLMVVVFVSIIMGVLLGGGEYVTMRIKRLKDVSVFATLDVDKSVKQRMSGIRVAFWVGALEMFKERPYLGVGLGKRNYLTNFPDKVMSRAKRVIRAKPHNFYLYILASTGGFGFLILSLFMLSILRSGHEAWKLERKCVCEHEKTLHIIIGNLLILVMQLGYQFDTAPFLWFLWAISFSWFYFSIHQHKPSRMKATLQHRPT